MVKICGLDDDCDGSADAGQLGLDDMPTASCKDIQVFSSLQTVPVNVPEHAAALCSDSLYQVVRLP